MFSNICIADKSTIQNTTISTVCTAVGENITSINNNISTGKKVAASLVSIQRVPEETIPVVGYYSEVTSPLYNGTG